MAEALPNEQKLVGTIERITFHNEDNGFCIIKVKVAKKRELVTVSGNLSVVHVGEHIQAFGKWVMHSKFGLQFQAEQLQAMPPQSAAGMEKYLASGMVHGIGPHFAKKLVEAFGAEVFTIIEEQPHRLHKLPGIGKARIDQLTASWKTQSTIRDMMVFLQTHGIGSTRAIRIHKRYGDQAIELIRQDPYCLVRDIHGIGFKTADQLAQKLNPDPESPQRIRAGLMHALEEQHSKGHSLTTEEDLLKETEKVLKIPENVIRDRLTEAVSQHDIVAHTHQQQPCYASVKLYQTEQALGQHIKRIARGKLPWAHFNWQDDLESLQKKAKITLSASQINALNLLLANKLSIITGGPGVGKTTLIHSFLLLLKPLNLRIQLSAPTGRAAKRMQETTSLPAQTIHRLLALDPANFQFKFHAGNPLNTDVLIVDEASMIDINLMQTLFAAVGKHTAVVLVGDVNQLPSVGPGNVLKDCIQSESVAVAALTEIFRQAKESQIILNAHRINQGSMPYAPSGTDLADFYYIEEKDPEKIVEKTVYVVQKRIPKRFNLDPIKDIQVLVPMHRGSVGAKRLNQILQQTLNPQKEGLTQFGMNYCKGDKVLQCINNYDKEVFNGDIGTITEVDLDSKTLKVLFESKVVPYANHELDELSLAYACSIHKSQGSEYPAVVIPIAIQHYTLLERNLIYTAITRGKQLVVLIGEKRALYMGIQRTQAHERLTLLKHWLNPEKETHNLI
jgi:exodeoxyribonuclease V alpha subunit